jgi:hypothetical protein
VFRAIFRPSSRALYHIYSIWYYSPMSLPTGVFDELKNIQGISRQQLGSKLPDTVKCP